MCPKLIELLSWNGPTIHFCCFLLARASTKTFVSRIHIRQPSPKNSEKIFVSRKIRQQGHSLAEVSPYYEFTANASQNAAKKTAPKPLGIPRPSIVLPRPCNFYTSIHTNIVLTWRLNVPCHTMVSTDRSILSSLQVEHVMLYSD